MEALVVSIITVPIYYTTWHHVPKQHNAESPPWEPQIYLPNYVTLCKTYEVHYEVWSTTCEVLTVLFTDGNSSLLRCDTVSLSMHCQHSAGPWCLHCEGQPVQVERSTLKTEALQLLKMTATAHTMTQHHMWHYVPADHKLDTKQVLLLTLLLIWGFWVAVLTNSIIDSLLFQPTNCLIILQGLRSYQLTGNMHNRLQLSIYL